MRRTWAGSLLTSRRPPAIRVLIVLMMASPRVALRSSKMGKSIVYALLAKGEIKPTNETYPAFLDKPLKGLFFFAYPGKILVFFTGVRVQEMVHADSEARIQGAIHLGKHGKIRIRRG